MRQVVSRVLAACLLMALMATATVVAAKEAVAAAAAKAETVAEDGTGVDIDMDEIDRVDDSIFAVAGDEFKPVEPMPPPPAAASDAAAETAAADEAAAEDESAAEADADASLAAEENAETASGETGADGRAVDEAAVGEDAATLFSFRAMAEATNAADSSVSEAADQTHKIARNYLKRSASADELFAEINREQQIFAAKRALVARQRATIADSIDSLKRLKAIVGENKQILKRNEKALKRASDDLLKLIGSYQTKLKANVNSELGIQPAPSVAAFPLIPPVSQEAPKQKPATPRKMRFAEEAADVEEEDADESEAETAEEGADEDEAGADADESSADQGWQWEYESDESADAESEADGEADAEAETDAGEESSEESAEGESESAEAGAEEGDAEAALVETESYDPESPRVSVLPGLSAPPPLYNPAEDDLI